MSKPDKHDWYEQRVGYRPQADDPTMTEDQLRELCESYEAAGH